MLNLIFLFSFVQLSCTGELIEPNPTPNSNSIKLSTSFTDDWDNWDFKLQETEVQVRTSFTEDWDNWDFNYSGESGDIRTNFSEDWDSWKLSTNSGIDLRMRTAFSEDWDNWDIDDLHSSWHADVRTSFSNDFDDWDIQINGVTLSVTTSFSNDFDNWYVSGSFPENTETPYKIASLFVPVITAVLIQNELITP